MILKGWVRIEKGNSHDKTKRENDTYISERKNYKLSTSVQLLLRYLKISFISILKCFINQI